MNTALRRASAAVVVALLMCLSGSYAATCIPVTPETHINLSDELIRFPDEDLNKFNPFDIRERRLPWETLYRSYFFPYRRACAEAMVDALHRAETSYIRPAWTDFSVAVVVWDTGKTRARSPERRSWDRRIEECTRAVLDIINTCTQNHSSGYNHFGDGSLIVEAFIGIPPEQATSVGHNSYIYWSPETGPYPWMDLRNRGDYYNVRYGWINHMHMLFAGQLMANPNNPSDNRYGSPGGGSGGNGRSSRRPSSSGGRQSRSASPRIKHEWGY